MNKFVKYNKIQNVTSSKLINKIVELGLDKQPYEVREKIHGANFSVTELPDGTVKFGKRSGYLGDDANFNNFQRISEALTKRVQKIRPLLDFASTSTITVFGEIFGGSFYGEQEPQTKRVQSGVEYHQGVKFMAFDIMVNGVYMQAVDTYKILREVGFDQAPVIKIANSLQEALEMPVEFTSTVPNFYGLECKPENLAEGYVIKPVSGDGMLGLHRLILKYKTAAFSENKGAKVGKAKIITLSDDDKEFLVAASRYINQNRLNNVLSKEEKPKGKEFPRIVGLLVQDALEDFVLDITVGVERGSGDALKTFIDDPKQFKKELNRIATNLLREQWADLILEL